MVARARSLFRNGIGGGGGGGRSKISKRAVGADAIFSRLLLQTQEGDFFSRLASFRGFSVASLLCV